MLKMRNQSWKTCRIISRGKTVLIVARRLSTVKDADQVIVMERGGIIESGNHDQLTINKGVYFELIKNQLELGN